MSFLTAEHIEFIQNELRQSGLDYDPLKNELLDHICCEVEKEMEKGVDFTTGYRNVSLIIGTKEIRRVYKDTLYLVNQKYRAMKRIMFLSGIVTLAFVITGTILKMVGGMGASLFNLVGMTLFGLIFLPAAFYTTYTEKKTKNTFYLYLTGFITAFLAVFGLLFKFQHYPGANSMIIIAGILLFFVFFPLYIIRNYDNLKKPLNLLTLISVAFITLIIGLFLILFVHKGFFYSTVLIEDQIKKTNTGLDRQNELVIKWFENDQKQIAGSSDVFLKKAAKIHSLATEMNQHISDLKTSLILLTEDITKEQAKAISSQNLKAKDNFKIPSNFLFGYSKNGKWNGGKAFELKAGLEEYKSALYRLLKENGIHHEPDDIRRTFDLLLNTDDPEKSTDDGITTWEINLFLQTPMLTVLTILSQLEGQVKMVENMALITLYRQIPSK